MVEGADLAAQYYSDALAMYATLVYYPGRHAVAPGKSQTYSVEADNAEVRHYLARLGRKSRCFSRSIDALRRAVKHFVHAWNRCMTLATPGRWAASSRHSSTNRGQERDEGTSRHGILSHGPVLRGQWWSSYYLHSTPGQARFLYPAPKSQRPGGRPKHCLGLPLDSGSLSGGQKKGPGPR